MIHESTSQSVFFYGLFMDADLLSQKGLNPKDVRLAYIDGFALRIGEKATLEPSETERVFGAVMNLGTQELRLLYSDEGVADYIPVHVTAFDLQGDRLDSISYILPMDQLSGRNPDYARALLAAAKRIGIPETHLNTIESLI